MEDWESVDPEQHPQTGAEAEPPKQFEQAEQVEPVKPRADKKPPTPRTTPIRVQLPSGSTLDICELTAGETAISESATPTDAKAAPNAVALWRTMSTNRRWNSTVQMLQNKLREDKRPGNVLRDAFMVAAEDFVLPGRLSRQDLSAKTTTLAAAFRGLPEWAWLGPVVQRLDGPEKKAVASDDVALEQAKVALLFAICCIYSDDVALEHNLAGVESPVVEAVPATFEVTVTGHATIAFGSALLAQLVDEQSAGLLTSVGFNMDFTAANRGRAALQTRAKQSAREQQLYGRKKDGPTAPGPLKVPCSVTLRGLDCAVLQRIADKAAEALRAEAAKRQRDDASGRSSRNSKRRTDTVMDHTSGEDGPSRVATALANTLLAGR